MLNHFYKRKMFWVVVLLFSLVVLLTTIISVIIIKIGPNKFVDDCLELLSSDKKELWVFLVAGSNGWSNYRHQADVAHAYHILLDNGIPGDRIIVMMRDDVVYDTQNPVPGQLFNHPNGSNVYQGLNIDYRGKDVNSENFLHVLTGNKTAMQNTGSGRVIKSGQSDNIFVNFVGHGSSGLLAFADDYLYADELNTTLNDMYNDGKFHRMLLYIESCKAGSLFDGILSETNNIFAVTAAGPRESSWSVYCYYLDYYDEPYVCIGDEFSVTWIEDQANIGILHPYARVNEFVEKRTVLNHFNYIRNMVQQSNVMPYGDFSVGQDKLSAYIGKAHGVFSRNRPNDIHNTQSFVKNKATFMLSSKIIKYSMKLNKSIEQLNGMNNNYKNKWKQRSDYNNDMRRIVDRVFNAIIQNVIKKWSNFNESIDELKKLPWQMPLNVFPCYRQTLNHLTKNCFSLPKNVYSLNSVHVFFNLCARVVDSDEWTLETFDVEFRDVVHNVCSKNSTYSRLLQKTDIY